MAAERSHFLDVVLPHHGVLDPAVRKAMARVPREMFVPPHLRNEAYRDTALPLDWGQAISQPSLVARMTADLNLSPGGRVLEIGTGSGYQAAVLAALGAEVFTIEIVQPLALLARRRLEMLGFDHIHFHIGDGHAGWPEYAPYAGIVLTCATPIIPPALPQQLAEGGRMVIPLGDTYEQTLVVFEKQAGVLQERGRCPVRFVLMQSTET